MRRGGVRRIGTSGGRSAGRVRRWAWVWAVVAAPNEPWQGLRDDGLVCSPEPVVVGAAGTFGRRRWGRVRCRAPWRIIIGRVVGGCFRTRGCQWLGGWGAVPVTEPSRDIVAARALAVGMGLMSRRAGRSVLLAGRGTRTWVMADDRGAAPGVCPRRLKRTGWPWGSSRRALCPKWAVAALASPIQASGWLRGNSLAMSPTSVPVRFTAQRLGAPVRKRAPVAGTGALEGD